LLPHLSNFTQVAVLHKRSVAVLQLRYWGAVILVTRPFLLYAVLRGKHIVGAEKRHWFEQLVATCINAAERSLGILKYMNEEKVLSSLVNSDCSCLLELIQIFLLALAKTGVQTHREQVRSCLKVLHTMENIGWTKQALPEVTRQLRECGILDSEEAEGERIEEWIGERIEEWTGEETQNDVSGNECTMALYVLQKMSIKFGEAFLTSRVYQTCCSGARRFRRDRL
jgi:hypothetical protein